MTTIGFGRRSFAVGLAAGAASFGFQARAQGEAIKVGVIAPLSGADGQGMLRAAQIAAAMVNAKGGVNGRRITVVGKDDEGTPAGGVARANEMVAERVAVVIGGSTTPVTLAVQTILARADVLDITAVNKADSILAGSINPYAIRINSSNGQDGAAIADVLLNKLGAKRIAFLTQNDAYGNPLRAVIDTELHKLGKPWENVAVEQLAPKQTDFRAGLASIKQARPDAVLGINAVEMPALIRQFREAEIGGVFVGAAGTIAPKVIESAGDATTGVVSADIWVSSLPPLDSIKEAVDFIAAFKAAHDQVPGKAEALIAQALVVWAAAANATKRLERRIVAGAIRNRTIPGTIFGDMAFEFNGQAKHPYTLFRVTDGKTGKMEVLK
jgi:branched-chain amino acid transport system substrate-binding protein